MNGPFSFRSAMLGVLAVFIANGMKGQMLDPSLDREDEPFCYFSKPTDVIGMIDGCEGTLVTPEGYFYTGYGELMLFVGNPPVPVDQRVKTLFRDRYPVVEYRFTREEISYQVQAFATTLTGRPEDPLVNFIQVQVMNTAQEPQVAWLGMGFRYQNDENTDWKTGDNRFARPAVAEILGTYAQQGEVFSRAWVYGYAPGMVVRDGRALLLFPSNPEPERFLTWKTGYNEPLWEGPQAMEVLPTTPVGNILYRLPLDPGSTGSLEFRMPYAPLDTASRVIDDLRKMSHREALNRTVSAWDRLFARGISIDLPEPKVVHTFDASLVYDLIARDKVEDWYIQKVNEFQYDAFWLRDAAHIVRMYDLSGYHDLARQSLAFFPRWQLPEGTFLSHGGQHDGWGQVLWAYGQHYAITRDRPWAASVYPSVKRAVQWLRDTRRQDELGLLPSATPEDNENISGHVTGHNFWALAGLQSAILLAEGAGETADTMDLRREYRALHRALMAVLERCLPSTGGAIPPGLDVEGGQDWGNMLAVYPVEIFDPDDPMVSATLAATRAKYQEGLMTYGDGRWLHHYLTLRNTETSLVRGEQESVIRDLYAVLVHTSATHAGFEFSIRPWGTRDFGMNLAPHGWFAAEYRTLLRNMLVRERGSRLHLLSALSPAWITPGARLAVHRAATDFGPIELTLEVTENGAKLTISPDFHTPPEALVVHIPWFLRLHSFRSTGETRAEGAGEVVLPPDTRHVELEWTPRGEIPALSYAAAVKAFRDEYRSRYERFRTTGQPR